MSNIDEQRDQLRRYADLKAQIAGLEDQLDMIRPEIEVIIVEINPGDKTVETDFGTFTLVPKRKYQYSPAVEGLSVELKEKKKEEEQTGTASYTEQPYVLFKPAIIS